MNALHSLRTNQTLIFELTKREIIGRYKGSLLGLFWSVFQPLVMFGIYAFVFGVVFKARWNQDGGESFALLLLTGLMCYSMLAECLNQAPTLITSRVNYVKRVVFPLEVFAWVVVFNATFHFLISLLILLVAKTILGGIAIHTWVFLPLVFLPLFLLCLSISWLLSSLGVYVRDIRHITGVLTSLLLFLCPIFYPLEIIPESFQIFIFLNPLTLIVEQARLVLVFSQPPDWLTLLVLTAFYLVTAQLCFSWFMRTKKGFADVI